MKQLSDADAAQLGMELERAWQGMWGTAPADLEEDLRSLGSWFQPRSSAKKLRSSIEELPVLAAAVPLLTSLTPTLALTANDRVIVTPEGRMVLELVRQRRRSVSLDLPPRFERQLLRLYREWSQEPLLKVVDDLDGRGERLYPAAAATLVVLLFLGCDSEQSALVIESGARSAETRALETLRAAFVDALPFRASKKVSEPFVGYPVSKAQRRVGSALRREPETGYPVRIWVSDRKRVLSVLAEELVAGREFSPDHVLEALGAVERQRRRLHRELSALNRTSSGGSKASELRRLQREFKRAVQVRGLAG